jgi:hypothetical protein
VYTSNMHPLMGPCDVSSVMSAESGSVSVDTERVASAISLPAISAAVAGRSPGLVAVTTLSN